MLRHKTLFIVKFWDVGTSFNSAVTYFRMEDSGLTGKGFYRAFLKEGVDDSIKPF